MNTNTTNTTTNAIAETAKNDLREVLATMTTTQVLDKLNEVRQTANGAELQIYREILETRCKEQSEALMQARMDTVLAMADDRKAMFLEFINNQTCTTVRLKQDSKTGEFSIKEGSKQITFSKLEKAWQAKKGVKKADGTIIPDLSATLAKSKRYYAMLTYFVDNVGRNIAGDLSEQAKKVTAPALTAGDASERKEWDFSGDSISALEKQMNALVGTILPPDLTIKMKRADVRAILKAATKENMLKFTLKNEEFFMSRLFVAMETRLNDRAYELVSKAAAHKEPSTTKNDKVSPPDPHTVDMAAAIPNRD